MESIITAKDLFLVSAAVVAGIIGNLAAAATLAFAEGKPLNGYMWFGWLAAIVFFGLMVYAAWKGALT